jgi:hypothetical protein
MKKPWNLDTRSWMPKLLKSGRLSPGIWLAFRASGICSATTGTAKPAGSSCSPGCGRSREPRTSFRAQGPPARRFNASSGIAFKSGKAKTLSSYLTSQQRGEAPTLPQPEGLRGFWADALLLVGQRPQRVFSLLAPRTQPKSAAALLYQSRTWCTTA